MYTCTCTYNYVCVCSQIIIEKCYSVQAREVKSGELVALKIIKIEPGDLSICQNIHVFKYQSLYTYEAGQQCVECGEELLMLPEKY